MKILDRYVARQLIFPILFCSIALIFLMFMADLFDNLDDMLHHKTKFIYILQYYLFSTPRIFVETISWASLLGTIFVLTHLNYHNEITAMKVSGLEIKSIIRPILFIGLCIGVFTFFVHDRIVPITHHHANELLEKRIERKRSLNEHQVFKNVTYFGGGNRLYYARVFDPELKQMNDFIILWLNDQKEVIKKTLAQKAIWTGSQWELHSATDYITEHTNELLGEPTYKKVAIYPEIQESPDEFVKAAMEHDTISYRDLRKYIQKMKENGIRLSSEAVDLQSKLALPWQSLLVMFICVPILAKSVTRRTIAWNVLTCLVIIFLYHIVGALFLALGKSGKLFPIISAWTHHLAFGFGAFFFLERAND